MIWMLYAQAICQHIEDQRPGGCGAPFWGDFSQTSALIAENLSEQGASNDMPQAQNLFQQKTRM